MNERFDLSKVQVSKQDIRKGLVFPGNLTKELAEFIGIMVGDGHLSLLKRTNKKGTKFTQSDIVIAGNRDEGGYLDHVCSLFNALFNRNLYRRLDKRSKAIYLTAHSKGILQFLNKVCEVPIGRKTNIIGIPNRIRKSSKVMKVAFLKGLADTDYYIRFVKGSRNSHSYPVVRASFKSRNLIEDLEVLYQSLDLNYKVVYGQKTFDKRFNNYKIMNTIYIRGKGDFVRWLDLVGSSHPKIMRRINKWQKDGYCPPGY